MSTVLAALHHENERALLVSETIPHMQRGQTLETVSKLELNKHGLLSY